VHNVEKYIRSCIESIYRQNLDESTFELIIVNDGTEDHSMEMIADIISQHCNITVINQENLSLSVARNNGIAAAKGEYILMPDSDDLLIENSVAPLLEKALETKADLVVADFLIMDDTEIHNTKTIEQKEFIVKEKTGEQLFMEDLNPHQCYVWRTLFRREFLLKENITFVPGIRYQDVPFTHECYLKARKCLRVSWLMNIYRKGHKSATSSFNKKKAFDLCIAIANTWKLKKTIQTSSLIQKKMNDDIFTSFTLLTYFMLYGIKSADERKEIFAFIRKEIPDMYFTNGMKQKLTSFLFCHAPNFYFFIRQVLKGLTPNPNF
jgi:glycosyltransferase involved in cell wall biosynthesis